MSETILGPCSRKKDRQDNENEKIIIGHTSCIQRTNRIKHTADFLPQPYTYPKFGRKFGPPNPWYFRVLRIRYKVNQRYVKQGSSEDPKRADFLESLFSYHTINRIVMSEKG